MTKNKRGFTLIELLVVIGIISILATFVTINVQSSRQKARCAKRRADIISLQAPLEAYYDANKNYPINNSNNLGSWWGTCSGNHDVYGPNGWIPNLAPAYIQRLPSDPNPSLTSGRCYLYYSEGQNYKILSYNPNEDGCVLGDPKDTLYDPVRPTYAWMVCSGEPYCSGY